jgi:hypothetical protein
MNALWTDRSVPVEILRRGEVVRIHVRLTGHGLGQSADQTARPQLVADTRCDGAPPRRPFLTRSASSLGSSLVELFSGTLITARRSGLELYAIHPKSIFYEMGLCNGDELLSIADIPLDSPERALEAYVALKQLKTRSVPVEIRRRGLGHHIHVYLTDSPTTTSTPPPPTPAAP